jgi:hypothetical protein
MCYLLRGDFKRPGPHVNFLEDIHAWNDEEDPRAPGSPRKEATEAEYDGSLVLLSALPIHGVCSAVPPELLSPPPRERAAARRR